MVKLIDGKKIAQKIYQEIDKKIRLLEKKNIVPKLGVFLIGNNPTSLIYVKQKQKQALTHGIGFDLHKFKNDIKEPDLISKIKYIQKKNQYSGLILQLPLPEHLETTKTLDAINPDLDVDCLTSANLGKLINNQHLFIPPTPAAIMTILRELKRTPKSQEITIIGTGRLVGKPLAIMLLNAEATVITCNEYTKNIKEKCLSADIIISATGHKNIITGDMIKPGAIVIDAGTSIQGNKPHGDINLHEIESKASFFTPTPGGVGPITVAHLLLNTVLSAEKTNRLN